MTCPLRVMQPDRLQPLATSSDGIQEALRDLSYILIAADTLPRTIGMDDVDDYDAGIVENRAAGFLQVNTPGC